MAKMYFIVSIWHIATQFYTRRQKGVTSCVQFVSITYESLAEEDKINISIGFEMDTDVIKSRRRWNIS